MPSYVLAEMFEGDFADIWTKKIPLMSMVERNLAKLGDGLHESPTVMVGEATRQLHRNRGILKLSWTVIETNT